MSLLDQTVKFLDFLRSEANARHRDEEVFSHLLIECYEIPPTRIDELEAVAQHMREAIFGMYATGQYSMWNAVGMGVAITILLGARLQKDNNIL